MAPTITYTEQLTVVTCTCGINYAIPQALNQQLLDHARRKSVHCPLGHEWHYLGKTDAELEREKREAAERREKATRALLTHEERSHAATRGHLTRQKKRASAGVCPCCNRTFQQLSRHMKTKHPEFVAEQAAPA